MRKLLTAVVVLPIAAVLLIFAVANRAPVVVSVDPFAPGSAGWSVELPLFLVIVLAVMLGVVIGGVADWFSQGRHRREARHSKSEIRRLEQEAVSLRRAQAPPQTSLPAPYTGEGA